MTNAYDIAELAQTLFEEAGDALFLFDPESEQILDANPMAQRLTGHGRQHLLRLKISYLFRSENQGGLVRLQNAFRKTGLFHSQEGFLLRHLEDGRWLPVNLTITRLHTDPVTLGLITARDIREQREAQLLLKKKEAELRRVLASVSDCLWSATVDPKGRWQLSFCSPVIEKISGRPAEHFLAAGGRWHDVMHPDDLVRVKVVDHLVRGDGSHEQDYRLLRPDGSVRWVRDSMEAHLQGDGSVRVDGVLTDITDRKLAQESLRQSQRLIQDQFHQLQTFFQNTPIALGLLDASLRYILVNERLAQLNGHSVAEHIGRSIREIIEPDVLALVEPLIRGVLETGEPMVNREFTAPTPQQPTDRRDWLVSYYPNRSTDGACTGIYAVLVDITERKRAEEKLRENEKQYRDLVETSNDLIWALDANGCWTFVNRQAARAIYGYEPEEMLGRHFTRFTSSGHVARDVEAFARIKAGQPHYHYETLHLRKDGTPVALRFNAIVLRDEEGQVLGTTGTATDITAWKKAEKALRKSEERYRLLFERNLAGVVRATYEGQVLDCNESFVRMLGYASRPEIVGRPMQDFYLDKADRAHLLERLQENPVLTNFELRMRRKNGTPIWVLANVSKIDSPEGPILLEGTIVDIDERKQALDALRASEAKYRCLIENLEQCVFLKDPELRFSAVNRHFCEAVGRAEADILGKTDLDFYPAALAEKYRADDLTVLLEGRTVQTEEQNVQRGKMRTVRVTKTAVRDNAGRVNGVLGIFWDITDQLMLEAQLRQAQKMEAIGQLAGGIAHDFNNLLTVILGNLSLVLSRQRPDLETSFDLLRGAEHATVRAAELTQSLLGFSRRGTLRSEPLNLNNAIHEAVRLLRRTIDPRIEVQTVCAEPLWLVKADPGMINQVLMNLALNARDAMPEGGRLVLETAQFEPDEEYLRLYLESRPGEHVRLRVRDTGVGIDPEIRQRIFEPFFTTKEVGKGTGLGLAMVFGIVKQHHGWVVCESALGEGTTFDVFLPRYRGDVAAETITTPAPAPAGHETILLVDDEPMIRNLAAMILKRLGYKILEAENGLQAVEIYKENQQLIDLVILDGTMPRLSGRDTIRALVQVRAEVRVLFSSGYADSHFDLADFPQIVGFMQKPYRVEELGNRVREVLDEARKHEAAGGQ